MHTLITLDQIRAAQQRIAGICTRTPLVKLEGAIDGVELYAKAESLQPIGSFKLRGASNKIAQLTAEQKKYGVITFSSGNHAQGVAWSALPVPNGSSAPSNLLPTTATQ